MSDPAGGPIQYEGKTLYAVSVTRTSEAVVYVLADSQGDAERDAEELATDLSSNDWDDVDDEVFALPASRSPRPGTPVWTGGPDGQDIPWPPSS